MASHKVLIPLDGSDFSRQIFPYVQDFLDQEDNRLVLLRVEEPPEDVDTEAEEPPAPIEDMTDKPTAPSTRLDPYGPRPQREPPEPDTEFAERGIYPTQVEQRRRDRVQDEMEPHVDRLRGSGYTVDVAVRFDKDPAESIVRFVESEGVDLIAMTTHGRSGLSRLVFGSVAEEVLRNASVPVLLLRPSEETGESGT